MAQHFKYLMDNRLTEDFFTTFEDKSKGKNYDHYVLADSANLIRKYTETFKQNGVINDEDCDEACDILLENIHFNSDIIDKVTQLENFEIP
jgi:hypothetical protein